MHLYIRKLKLLVALLILVAGCYKPPSNIDTFLQASSIHFQPAAGDPVPLTQTQANSVREIIAKFKSTTDVRKRNAIAPAADGRFVSGTNSFPWVDDFLYFRDKKRDVYYVVHDEALLDMLLALRKAKGSELPLKSPTSEQWQQILTKLEKPNK